MSEFYAQIVKIEKVEKHPNADTLSIYTVLNDYPVIDKIGKFNLGDLVSYVPESAIVPDNELFYFLCPQKYEKYLDGENVKTRAVGLAYTIGSIPQKYRVIKAKNIRNFYSQGLLLPVPEGMAEGDSIIDYYGLSRVEEDNEENIVSCPKTKGRNAESPPKGWTLPYYDVDGLRKYISHLKQDEEIVISEKIEGSNSSYCFDGNKLWVKSRNFFKKDDPDCPWWIAAKHLNLEDKLQKYPMLAFFGELYGIVKNFRYNVPIINGVVIPSVIFFDIYDINSHRYLDYDDTLTILKDLDLPAVPELYRGYWTTKEEMYSFAEGQSTLNSSHVREGFVLKTTKERYESALNGRMQIKLVGEGYNLKKYK